MADNAPTSGGPVAAEVLQDLAAASRILFNQGVVDGYGHVSMRHPTAPQRFLMSRAVAPAAVVPEDIIEFDLDSTPIDATGERASSSASSMARSSRQGRTSWRWCTAIRPR